MAQQAQEVCPLLDPPPMFPPPHTHIKTNNNNNGQPCDASDADAINNAKCDAICETSQRQQQQLLQQQQQQQQQRWQQIAAVKIALPQRRKGDCWPL